MALFTTSKMGLGIMHTGAGERPKDLQPAFRFDLIREYGAKHPEEDWVWCPITSNWWPRFDTRAGHLFAYMHGQEVMNSIFGKTSPPELFSPKNGILIYRTIEEYFDKGKIVIVPDIQAKLSTENVLDWLSRNQESTKLSI
jgi:HNH endonuclease